MLLKSMLIYALGASEVPVREPRNFDHIPDHFTDWHGGFPDPHGDFTDRNGDFTDRNGDFTDRNGDLTDRNGDFTDRYSDEDVNIDLPLTPGRFTDDFWRNEEEYQEDRSEDSDHNIIQYNPLVIRNPYSFPEYIEDVKDSEPSFKKMYEPNGDADEQRKKRFKINFDRYLDSFKEANRVNNNSLRRAWNGDLNGVDKPELLSKLMDEYQGAANIKNANRGLANNTNATFNDFKAALRLHNEGLRQGGH